MTKLQRKPKIELQVDELKEYAKKSGLKWYQIGKRLNVSHTTMYRIRDGKSIPRMDLCFELCKLLNMPLEKFIKMIK